MRMKVKYLLTIGLAAFAMSAFAQDNAPIEVENDYVMLEKTVVTADDAELNAIRVMLVNPTYSYQAINFDVQALDGVTIVSNYGSGLKKSMLWVSPDEMEPTHYWAVSGNFKEADGVTGIAGAKEGVYATVISYAADDPETLSIPKGDGTEEAPKLLYKFGVKLDPAKFTDGEEADILVLRNVDFASLDAKGHAIYPKGMMPEAKAAGTDKRQTLRVLYVADATAIKDVKNEANVASVKYYNLAGAESNEAFQGVNLMVTKYTDGTTKTVKVIK